MGGDQRDFLQALSCRGASGLEALGSRRSVNFCSRCLDWMNTPPAASAGSRGGESGSAAFDSGYQGLKSVLAGHPPLG